MAGAIFLKFACGGEDTCEKNFLNTKVVSQWCEFALILPLLILMLCGIIDFGWIFMNQSVLNNASRETTRYMTMNYDKDITLSANQTVATTKMKAVLGTSILSNSSLTVTFTVSPSTNPDSVTVTASYPLPTLTPILAFAVNGKVTIDSVTTMRLE